MFYTTMRNLIFAYDRVNRHHKPEMGYSPATLFQCYFAYNISYPKQAIEFLTGEGIYLSLELDDEGVVNDIKLLKSNSIDLVLESANALARLPRLNLRNKFFDYS
jgi:hypothetical protein